MLYTTRPARAITPITEISGKRLAKWRREGKLSPENRARLALALQTGRVKLGKLTARQVRWLTGATVSELAAARRAQRPAHAPRPAHNGQRVLYRRNLSDIEVDRAVAELGTNRVLAALDRATRPAAVAAE
jgi:hypothetical protein